MDPSQFKISHKDRRPVSQHNSPARIAKNLPQTNNGPSSFVKNGTNVTAERDLPNGQNCKTVPSSSAVNKMAHDTQKLKSDMKASAPAKSQKKKVTIGLNSFKLSWRAKQTIKW